MLLKESKVAYLGEIFPVTLEDHELWAITDPPGEEPMEHLH